MALEICVDSLASVLAAQEGGADRIELCAELASGGLTPSHALIEECVRSCHLDVMLMIRPRSGNFVYSDDDFFVMAGDVAHARNKNVHGVALGALTPTHEIDVPRVRRLVEIAQPLEVTFHRAFDLTPDPFAALETLIELGVDRVLSSGQAPCAAQGIPLLRELVRQARDRIVVMAGGGINKDNLRGILRQTGVRDCHASAREPPAPEPEARRLSSPRGLSLGDSDDGSRPRRVACARTVRALATIARSVPRCPESARPT